MTHCNVEGRSRKPEKVLCEMAQCSGVRQTSTQGDPGQNALAVSWRHKWGGNREASRQIPGSHWLVSFVSSRFSNNPVSEQKQHRKLSPKHTYMHTHLHSLMQPYEHVPTHLCTHMHRFPFLPLQGLLAQVSQRWR